MASEQQRPRVSILVDGGGAESGVRGGSSTTGHGGIGPALDGTNNNSPAVGGGEAGMSPQEAQEGASSPTAIPAEEGDAVNVTNDAIGAGEERGDDDKDEDEEGDDDDAADDESDYSYTYEDEDEGQYSGFLIPTDNFEPAAVGNDGAAAGGAPVVEEAAVHPNPPTIARAVSRMSDGAASPVPETNPTPAGGERKPKWREPTRAAVDMSLRAEKEKTGGRRRLASDLYKIMMADTEEAGFSLEPADEDSMDKWCIKLFGFDEDSNLAKDLVVCHMDHVQLEMSFPDQYPFEPPFVRVVKPRFKRQTGFVMSGALCMELLTKDGWNPINDIESVIVSIRSLMVVGDGRLQAAVDMKREEYQRALEENAKKKKGEAGKASDKAEGENEEMGEAKRKRAPSDDDEGGDGKGEETGKSKPASAKRASGGSYTAAEAQSAYDHLSKYHKKEGWDKSGWWSRKG